MTTPDPVEDYLDELVRRFGARSPRELRDLLFEADAHLRDAVDRYRAVGLPDIDAKRRAVADMGTAHDLAEADQQRLRPSSGDLIARFVVTAALLGAVAAVAVGISGVVSDAAASAWGTSSVVDVGKGHALTASSCARWLAEDPGAVTCREAALDDWIGEVVVYRMVVGAMGTAVLGALWLGRRHIRYLPSVVVHTIGALGFGAAMLWTIGVGLDGVATTGSGTWQWFSAGIPSVAAAVYFSARLVGDLRAPTTWTDLARR